ncbi:MAG: hypothetical protein MI684_06110 [Chlorobiales bacterium]|nr:hypothetical protein [Chlorobiales bacterium]
MTKNEISSTDVRSKLDDLFGNPEFLFENIRNNAGHITTGYLIEKELPEIKTEYL